jgi:hypothetical protein
MQTLWSVVLQAGSNFVVAVATITFAFAPTDAGLQLYGVGLYDPTSFQLFYTEQFPAVFIVPTGGSTLTWTFNLAFGDCSQIQGQ